MTIHIGPKGTDEGLHLSEDTIHAELWYPRVAGNRTKITVGLSDVRAADDLAITYDFDRDGWSISREVKIQRDGYMEDTGQWVEVSFVAAWTEPAPWVDGP